MRIYLSLLCLALSTLSYGNDLISGYQWRSLPAPLIKISSQNDKLQSDHSFQEQALQEHSFQEQNDPSDEHNNKAADSSLKPNKANLNCKQTKNRC